MVSIRDKIAASNDTKREHVNAWGTKFYLREMTQGEREQYINETRKALANGEQAPKDLAAGLIVTCAVDGEWKPVFTEDDIPMLSAKSWRTTDRLVGIILDLNGFGDDEEAMPEDVKKNSKAPTP